MPQTIFYIVDTKGNIIVGRKTLSQYFLNNELKSLNCSRITYNMILGVLYNVDYRNRKINLMYYPFTQDEKKFVFENIRKNKKNFFIDYPFRFRYFNTNEEQTSDNLNWDVDEKLAKYLSIGESHIRNFAKENLMQNNINPKVIYDPACSTGEFLKDLKEIFPDSTTIGHDLNESMVKYSKKNVDKSFCCDANNSPIMDKSVDLLVLRFLNGGVVDSVSAKKLFDKLIKKVVDDGYILCIGHTPILIPKTHFDEQNLSLIDTIGYDEKSDSIFQYYLAKK